MDLLYYSALLYTRKTLPFLRSKTKNAVFPDPVPHHLSEAAVCPVLASTEKRCQQVI